MNYPRMLCRDGVPSDDYRVVADEAEEAEAIKAGYIEAYTEPKPTARKAKS